MNTRRIIALLTLCISAAIFTGCSKDSPAAQNADAPEEELTEYVVEGVGTFYLPEGFNVESGVTEEGLPMHYAEMTKDSLCVRASRFGLDAYEAAGVPLPEDLDDYSTRDGVRQNLPADAEFTRDKYDNLFVKYTEDGNSNYQYLKKGTESYGAFMVVCPEGQEDDEAFALWASKATLE